MDRRKFLGISLSLVSSVSLFDMGFGKDSFEAIKFGIVTDIHYANAQPANNRYYKESLDKLDECIQVMNDEQVDFLIELGDFKDSGSPPDEKETLAFLERIEQTFNRFNGPCYHVLGNHDEDIISKKQFLSRITNGNFPEAENYYSFEKNSFQFITLDANFTSKGISYNHGNFDWKDTYIPNDQLQWLSEKLRNSNLPTIIFIHQRLDSFQSVSSYSVKNADEVRKILEESGNVLAVFQGHYHPGAMNEINNIYYYTLRGMIEGSGPENNSYAIVEIRQNFNKELTIDIKGYRKASSYQLG